MNKKFIFLTFLLFSVLGFFSCSNPLSNTDLSISRSAKNFGILEFSIESKDGCGYTEPDGEVSYKIGNTYSIVFSEKDGYQFEKWEVINKETGKVYSDVISFENKNEPETTIKILRNAENVVLRAVAKKRPETLSTSPLYAEEGVYCDSVIVIEFDQKIAEDSFYFSTEDLMFLNYDSLLKNEDSKVYGYIFNNEVYYKNLFISSKTDENLIEYFYPPVIENGTIIKIFPKLSNPLVSVSGKLLDIDLFLGPDVYTEDGVKVGGEGVQWRYRVNSKTDKTAPQFTDFELSTESNKLIKGLQFNGINHIQKKVNYKYSGIDKESGVNFIQVEQKLLYSPDGNEVNEEPIVRILQNGADGEGNFELETEDGVVQLTFTLFDFSGNASKNSIVYLVAKDTEIDLSSLNLYKKHNFKDGDVISINTIKNNANTLYWTFDSGDIWANGFSTPSSEISYELFWGQQKDNLQNHIECSKKINYQNGVWNYTIPVLENSLNTYLRLQAKDDVGNISFVDTVIPSVKNDFVYSKISGDADSSNVYRIFYSKLENIKEMENYSINCFLYYSEDGNKFFVKSFEDKYVDISVKDISKCKLYFQYAYVTKNSYMLSAINEFSFVETEIDVAPVVKNITVTKGAVNSGKNIANIEYSTVAPNGVSFDIFWGDSENTIVNYENSNTFEIDSNLSQLYYRTVYVDSKTGISNSGDVHVYNLGKQNYDTNPPKIQNYQCICNYKKTDEYLADGYYPVITCDICYDEYNVKNNNASYVLYTVHALNADEKFEDITVERIKASPFVTGSFVPPQSKEDTVLIWNKVEGIKYAESYFYVLYLEDANGNYAYYPLAYHKQLLENVPIISYKQNKKNPDLVDISFEILKENRCKNYQIEYSIFNTEKEIENFVLCSSVSEVDISDKSGLQTKNGVLSADFTDRKDSFYFGFAKAIYQSRNNNIFKYTYPVYFYTGLDESINCELKDVIDDRNGAQIYCDRPCLVVTYWSSENYGYSVESWESYGVQTNPMMISAKNADTDEYEDTFKFYEVNRKEIPMGKYFVIIAHFADGTSIMSKTINTN